MTEGLPLSGVKVIDLTWVVVGPSAIRVLADYGATVIKVESATRVDTARTIGPYKDATPGPERTGCFISYNAGKLGLTLNLATEPAREVVKRLAAWADVLAESFTPKAMRSWGLGYDELRQVNPGLVYLSTCLAGQTGPYSQFAGYGNLGAALMGFTNLLGWPDRPPAGPAGAYTDYVAAKFITSAVLAALDYREETGRGQYIDLSQGEAAAHFIAPALLDYEVNGHVLEPQGNRSAEMSPHGVFRAHGEDRWVAIAAPGQREWEALCAAMGGPELASDQRFATEANRRANEDELERIIEAWTSARSAEEIQEALIAAGVPCHVVAVPADALADPQLQHRKHFVTVPHTELGDVAVENSRFQLSRTPARIERAGPTFGQDNDYVLREVLGLSDEEVVELAASAALE